MELPWTRQIGDGEPPSLRASPQRAPAPQLSPIRGFTMIEVLIAITVLSIGLLGLAALQISALRNGQQSFQRTQASALAYDLADRMRANRLQALTGGSYPAGYAVTPTTLPDTLSTTNCAASSSVAAPCSSVELAAWDLSNWAVKGVRAQLTGGTAEVHCTGTCSAGQLQTITVMWDEFRTGARDASCPAAKAYDRNVHLACFTIEFTP